MVPTKRDEVRGPRLGPENRTGNVDPILSQPDSRR